MRTPTFVLEAYLEAVVPYRIHCLGSALLAVRMKVYCYRKKRCTITFFTSFNRKMKKRAHQTRYITYQCTHASLFGHISVCTIKIHKNSKTSETYWTRQALFDSSKDVCKTLAIATRKSSSIHVNVFKGGAQYTKRLQRYKKSACMDNTCMELESKAEYSQTDGLQQPASSV